MWKPERANEFMPVSGKFSKAGRIFEIENFAEIEEKHKEDFVDPDWTVYPPIQNKDSTGLFFDSTDEEDCIEEEAQQLVLYNEKYKYLLPNAVFKIKPNCHL